MSKRLSNIHYIVLHHRSVEAYFYNNNYVRLYTIHDSQPNNKTTKRRQLAQDLVSAISSPASYFTMGRAFKSVSV